MKISLIISSILDSFSSSIGIIYLVNIVSNSFKHLLQGQLKHSNVRNQIHSVFYINNLIFCLGNEPLAMYTVSKEC